MIEVWKDIKGYKRLYQVSSLGRVKSFSRRVKCGRGSRQITARILKYGISSSGYFYVSLWKDLQMISISVHRLVANAFTPNLESKAELNHKDGDKRNNIVGNLEWCTRKENMIHKDSVLGKHTKGEKNGFSKLMEKDILEIKSFLIKGLLSQQQIANKYDVSQKLISLINSGKSWTHVRV